MGLLGIEKLSIVPLINKNHYYVAVSHKDWELPNSQIWLAEIDIESGLDFPIYTGI